MNMEAWPYRPLGQADSDCKKFGQPSLGFTRSGIMALKD